MGTQRARQFKREWGEEKGRRAGRTDGGRGCGEDSLLRRPSEKQVPCPVGQRVCLYACVVLHRSLLTVNILGS